MLRNKHAPLIVFKSLPSMAAAPLLLVLAASLVTTDATKLMAQAPSPTETIPVPATLPSGTAIKLDGSDSMSIINQALKKRFEEKFPGSTVNLAANGTDQALKELLNGQVELAAIGRPLTDAEKAQGLKEVTISREKIAIIVGPDNPFNGSITIDQFAKIFRGEITDWSQVGGQPGPIRFIDRPASSDTRQAISQYPVFKNAPFKTGANSTQVTEDKTDLVVKELGKDGIGYAIVSQVEGQSNARAIKMHDTLPTDPRYPFSQARVYVFKGSLQPGAQAFLGFATSAAGQEVVLEAKKLENQQVVPPSPSPGAVATPEASPAPEGVRPASPGAVATSEAAPTSGGVRPTWGPLWWLLLPLIGLPLLFAWLKGRGGAVAGAAADRAGRIVLTPRNCRDAYAYWEIPEQSKADLRQQGGRNLMVRLYDVTDIADMDRQTPHSVKQFDCPNDATDLHLPIAQDDRDYVAEVGYTTQDGRWLKLARSEHVRVPACPPGTAATLPSTAGTVATGAAVAAGTTAAGLAAAQAFTHIPRNSRIVMTPRTPEDAYVYWEVPEEHKAEVRRQGGRKLMLRVYDATNIDLDQQTAHSFRQYECSELDTDKHVPIPVSDRDYVAELGYITDEGSWLSLTRSEPVRVPSPKNVVGDDPNVDAAARVAATEFTEGSSWKPLEGLARTVSGRLEGVAEKSSDLLGDTTRTASDLADQVTDKASGLLGQTPDKVSDLADEASKAMGTAIAGGAAAVAGIGAVAQSFLDRGRTVLGGERTESGEYVMPRDCRIILVPRNSRDAYAYWEVSEQYKQAARQQGGRRLMLRVHDATNLDIDQQPPHSTQEYALTDLDTDKHVPIPVSDRDYIAELGYYTDDNQWIRIIRSFHVRVPAND